MPVRSADPETDEVGRFNRLSASQANTWEDCPRLWYYQNKMRLKFPQSPPLFLGRAVEECVCRVLMESPGLVFANAPLDVMKNGADNLLPLFDDELIYKNKKDKSKGYEIVGGKSKKVINLKRRRIVKKKD